MTVAIVGASQAGLQTASSLRDRGYDQPIVLIGEEPHAPYQRPPLSKGYLSGAVTQDMLTFRDPAFYQQHAITLVTGERVVSADRETRRLRTASGLEIAFDQLVLATGCRARTLTIPGADLPGVHYLRSIGDADLISERLAASNRLVVIGGGFIGLEVAAMAALAGKQVVVLEAADRLMGRVVGQPLSEFFHGVHRQQGIDIRLRAQAKRIVGTSNGVQAVELTHGERIAADMVIAGVGSVASVDLACQLGVNVNRGIVVNDRAQTSIPEVLAAGDCTARPLADGGTIRLESVHNALEQANVAAATLMGQPPPPTKVPWFWSDQGKMKLQMAGLSSGFDRSILRGTPETGKFSVFYLRSDVVIAAESVNSPGDHLISRRLIEQRASIDSALLADVSVSLKQLADEHQKSAMQGQGAPSLVQQPVKEATAART